MMRGHSGGKQAEHLMWLAWMRTMGHNVKSLDLSKGHELGPWSELDCDSE
jgi:hypothetical protein